MIVLQANQIDKFFGVHQVLKQVSFTINQNEKVGVVGPNGAGKTTLLKCFTGEVEPDSGDISLAAGLKIGYLEQLPEEDEGVTAWDAVMESFSDLLQLRAEIHELERLMSQADADLDKLYARYARVTHHYELENGYACEAMARRVLVGLGLNSEQFERSWYSFSGGEKTRINLARLLVRSPDLLLLDEPTNHLDLSAVEWLESFLASYNGTLIVVSHDRRFLDQVANRIIEVQNDQVRSFPGNYTNYLKLKAEQDLAAQKAYAKQQEYIKKTEEYIARYRAGIKSKQARGRQSQLDRLQRLAAAGREQRVFLNADTPETNSGDMVVEVSGVKFGYNDQPLLAGIDLMLRRGERAALVGRNGTGKTTLLKILLGELTPDYGEIRWGGRVKRAYLSQHNEDLNPDQTVVDTLVDATGWTTEQARTRLASMGFSGDDVFKLVASLSGGERMRLALLKVISGKPNLLVLDEPTNHLDINSSEVVEEMLDDFEGTLLMVSHDRYLLDRVADKIIELKDGTLNSYPGNYSYYRERVAVEQREQREAEVKPLSPKTADIERENKKAEQQRLRRLHKELAAIEAEIDDAEAAKADLEAALSNPSAYADEEQARDLTNRYRLCGEQLDRLYEQWTSLQEQAEKQNSTS